MVYGLFRFRNHLLVDYDTGALRRRRKGHAAQEADGQSTGARWEPVFGKYAFLADGLDGADAAAGDEVAVTRRAADWAYADQTIFARFYRYA